MAIKSANGFFTEETPQSITQSSVDQGLGTPETPKGAAAAGGTPQQAAQTGTPNQTQNAQSQPSKTLEQTKRYDKKPQDTTNQQQSAREAADTLSTLGPVRANVQSLIQSRMQTITGTDTLPKLAASLQLNTTAIEQLPADQQAAVTTAMQAYLESPSETTANAVYNLLGPEALENQGIRNFIQGDEATIQQVTQGALGDAVTLGALSAEGGLETDLQSIADALGVSIEQVQTMTLQQLDASIDAVEANELNQVEQIRAQLNDLALPPQVRQDLLKQLGQLSAAGITGAEAGIDRLDAQIQAADTVSIGGVDMSLEDALSDKGISATIAKAVQDPDYLDDLIDLPGYEGLASWIEENKESLETLVGEIEDTTGDFVTLQYEYEDIKNSLGTDGQELLAELFPNEDFSGKTIMSGGMNALKTKLKGNSAYQFLTSEDNERWLNEAKNSPDTLEDIQDLASSGFAPEDMDDVLDAMTEIKSDKTMAALFGSDLPESPEDWAKMQADLEIYENLDPSTQALGDLVQAGKLSLEDLQDISESPNREDILADISQSRVEAKSWKDTVSKAKDKHKGLLEYLFGQSGFSVRDLNATVAGADEETKAKLLAIFDADGDGKITDKEFKSPANAARAMDTLGIGMSASDITKAGGDWDAQGIRESLEVTKGGWFNTQHSDATSWSKSESARYSDAAAKYDTEISKALSKLGIPEGKLGTARRAKRQYLDLNKKHLAERAAVTSLSEDQIKEKYDMVQQWTSSRHGPKGWIKGPKNRWYEPMDAFHNRVKEKIRNNSKKELAELQNNYEFDITNAGGWNFARIDKADKARTKAIEKSNKFKKFYKQLGEMSPEDEEDLAKFMEKYM
jgi:hypothetical protein